MNFNINTINFVENAEKKVKKQFENIDNIAYHNQYKVLNAFQNNAVQAHHFNGTSGYGYDDCGRDNLNKVFADIFDTESAIVSPNFVSGTHALTVMLFGILRPNDYFLSISGEPYDTLNDIIHGKNKGSLNDYNISYKKIDLKNNKFNMSKILSTIKKDTPKMVYIQRSRGYEWRDALSIPEISKAIQQIKSVNSDIVIAIDNNYGEFIDKIEPTSVGADLISGSLIKNAGGGIAPTGAYIAGKANLIEQISYRFTSPSIGNEVGSHISGYLPYYQGIFLAPITVANALKGSILMGQVYNDLGYETLPKPKSICNDIIRSIKFKTEFELIEFCRAIQASSPVDSNVTPYPSEMPGYKHQIIMASGAFMQGSSIELSADSPIKEPFIAYLQGGLTYEHVKIATCNTIECLSKLKKNF